MKVPQYWNAVEQVYSELFEILIPGGVACVVVEDFVKEGQIVPLGQQTSDALEFCGFKILEHIHALKIEQSVAEKVDILTGEVENTDKVHKGFWRRNAEERGAPPIDWETVIIARKS